MEATPYQISRRIGAGIQDGLPEVTLEPLDLVLACFEMSGQPITILQVGACDGVKNDLVRRQVCRGTGQAVLVEPNPLAFSRLQQNYLDVPNVRLVQAAVGNDDGEAPFFRMKMGDRSGPEDWKLQISSFYREHLHHHGVADKDIEEIRVSCRSLSSLVTELQLGRIDVLQIDVEGFDAAVVRMALAMPVPPQCINFEHRHLSAADRHPLFDLLRSHGYLLSYSDWNLLAVQKTTMDRWRAVSPGLESTPALL